MTGWITSGDETDENRVIRAEEDMAGSAMIGDLDLVYKYFRKRIFSSMFWPLTYAILFDPFIPQQTPLSPSISSLDPQSFYDSK